MTTPPPLNCRQLHKEATIHLILSCQQHYQMFWGGGGFVNYRTQGAAIIPEPPPTGGGERGLKNKLPQTPPPRLAPVVIRAGGGSSEPLICLRLFIASSLTAHCRRGVFVNRALLMDRFYTALWHSLLQGSYTPRFYSVFKITTNLKLKFLLLVCCNHSAIYFIFCFIYTLCL